MQWVDEGIVINTKRFGESHFIASILTCSHGRHLGLARKNAHITSIFQPGTKISLHWKARLSEHLGTWSGDFVFSPLADIFEKGLLLAALGSACALIDVTLPEREPHPDVYHAFHHFIYALNTPFWPDSYIYLERVLLENAGITLDFSRCAATGMTEDLVYLSPRTGRAVSREAGLPYHDKLLLLPSFLTQNPYQNTERKAEDILEALDMMETFLTRFILDTHHLKMPNARERLKAKLQHQLKLKRIA